MRLLAQLSHQNIASVHELKNDNDGKIYVIMEYIDGSNLQQVLHAGSRPQKRLREDLCVYIAAETCAALDFIHSCRHSGTKAPLNLIHQELAPAHLMITRAGEVKLIGFGMRNLRPKPAANQDETFAPERLNYLAPEQLEGATTLDHRVNIFALGLVLYETLTGQHLLAAGASNQAPENRYCGRADLSCLHTEGFSPKLQEILHRALAHTPEERYANANQMYMDLMHYLMLIAPELNCKAALVEFMQKVCPREDGEDEKTPPVENKTATTPEDDNAPRHETTNRYQTTAEFFNYTRVNKNFASGNGETLYEDILYGKAGMAQALANARDSISASNGYGSSPTSLVFEAENAPGLTKRKNPRYCCGHTKLTRKVP